MLKVYRNKLTGVLQSLPESYAKGYPDTFELANENIPCATCGSGSASCAAPEELPEEVIEDTLAALGFEPPEESDSEELANGDIPKKNKRKE